MKRDKPAEMTSFSTRLPAKLVHAIKLRAVQERTTTQELAGRVFTAYLKQPVQREASR
jgi:hypothetical protein